MAALMKNPPILLCFDNAPAFRQWLQSNAAHCSELLMHFRKVGVDRPCMTYSESVDEALCFGWIDGVRKRVDEHTYSIRFTPRRASSNWSAVNIAKVHQLHAAGRLTHAGEKAFALRTSARSAIYSHEQPSPADLSRGELETLKRNWGAWQFFEATPAWLQEARSALGHQCQEGRNESIQVCQTGTCLHGRRASSMRGARATSRLGDADSAISACRSSFNSAECTRFDKAAPRMTPSSTVSTPNPFQY